MQIQCECGQFKAEVSNFSKKNSPGRCVCYCDDCQTYLHYLGRADLLDKSGGTEVVPVYPANIKFLSGEKNLKLVRLSPTGMYRFSTTCCNTPIGNTNPTMPWTGLIFRMFTVKDPTALEKTLGPIKARIMGKFATTPAPAGTPATMSVKSFMQIMPFLFKGLVLGKKKPSPFFKDGHTPIVEPNILSLEERKRIRESIFKN